MMKKLVLIAAAVALTACGQIKNIMDGTEHLPDQIAETNRGMAQTNESIRLQKLAVSLDHLMQEENQMFLSPIPGDMMGPGKLLAETLTAEEAVKLIYVKMVNINENTYRDQYPEDEELKNAEQMRRFERSKLALFYSLQIVAGFLPDHVVQEIIHTEVMRGGRYFDTALQILSLRSSFYDKVMLKASLLKDKLKTVGMVTTAIEYNEKIDFIAKLKFAPWIGIKITGFMNQEMNAAMSVEKLDIAIAKNNWEIILDRVTPIADHTGAMVNPVELVGVSGDPAADAAEMARQQEVLRQSILKIQSHLTTWAN
ncbi:MAG: hypothetical protein A2622_11285 [Bdellovibrionales bacterium RIFCSPHIGHO2_01_FULL_40_29]|nr:MAG: hypothetical protein A2622_11285 [Bdellovibrionales bacterium RIFCSPHIGHO2_01_FULL_40_29]OFZ34533.1 MAG: hypothetical protein A3D17_01550 [Bdellovibrionales bacterium RIFCSPHIGHO2_02_FULL_40_15]